MAPPRRPEARSLMGYQGRGDRTTMNATSDLQIVVCQLGEERYGLEIGKVHEIIRHQAITSVPGAPPAMEGIINLRGRIIPVVDLRTRFDMERAAPTRASRIVVADTGGTRMGLIVDAVSEVLTVPADAIEPAETVVGDDTAALRGIAKLDGRLVILLALEGLLVDDGLHDATHEVARPSDATEDTADPHVSTSTSPVPVASPALVGAI